MLIGQADRLLFQQHVELQQLFVAELLTTGRTKLLLRNARACSELHPSCFNIESPLGGLLDVLSWRRGRIIVGLGQLELTQVSRKSAARELVTLPRPKARVRSPVPVPVSNRA